LAPQRGDVGYGGLVKFITSDHGASAVLDITARIETLLRGIDSALERLESGHYGRCSDCGAEISAVRLRAMPFADSCRDCQELADADCKVLAA
jgi:RNA polymerase-binding transcription factor DksA